MVKKSIIAIALLAMLTSVSFAQLNTPDPNITSGIKFDSGKWPVTCTYTPIQVCEVPVYIQIGMFIKIANCGNGIVMKEIACPAGKDFPCYHGCITLQVYNNFCVILKEKFTSTSSVLVDGSKLFPSKPGTGYKAYFTNGEGDAKDTITVPCKTDNYNGVELCVDATGANIWKAPYAPAYNRGTCTGAGNVQVGTIAITALPCGNPNVSIDCVPGTCD